MTFKRLGDAAQSVVDILVQVKRQECLERIWRQTHRDYRSSTNGVRKILVLRQGGTCLVPLECLTDDEIKRKLA